MVAAGKAEENVYGERLIRTIQEEELYVSEYGSFSDAHAQIRCFVEDVYITKRIHSSMGNGTQVVYEIAWWQSHVKSVMESP